MDDIDLPSENDSCGSSRAPRPASCYGAAREQECETKPRVCAAPHMKISPIPGARRSAARTDARSVGPSRTVLGATPTRRETIEHVAKYHQRRRPAYVRLTDQIDSDRSHASTAMMG